jgi:hypothetical protein
MNRHQRGEQHDGGNRGRDLAVVFLHAREQHQRGHFCLERNVPRDHDDHAEFSQGADEGMRGIGDQRRQHDAPEALPLGRAQHHRRASSSSASMSSSTGCTERRMKGRLVKIIATTARRSSEI